MYINMYVNIPFPWILWVGDAFQKKTKQAWHVFARSQNSLKVLFSKSQLHGGCKIHQSFFCAVFEGCLFFVGLSLRVLGLAGAWKGAKELEVSKTPSK